MATARRPTSSTTVDPCGSLTDVDGVTVGHHQRIGRGWRTGTTVVLTRRGASAGVDVRGGGPGTRETDLLRPENLIQQVHGICLTGGSAFGLSAADGVMRFLEDRQIGFPVGPSLSAVVPIVPSAVIFDLGRGGSFDKRPDAEFGRRAAAAARARPEGNGSVGAGTGATSGGLQGGVGSASVRLEAGIVVAALAVVNSAGSVIDLAAGLPWDAAAHDLRRPQRSERDALRLLCSPGPQRGPDDQPLNTTIGVVATSALLSKAECAKVATVAHDGMARAVRPAHSMFDGDTVFALATGVHDLPEGDPAQPLLEGSAEFRHARTRAAAINVILEAGALCFAAACTQAVLAATCVGGPLAYRDVCPSAFAS